MCLKNVRWDWRLKIENWNWSYRRTDDNSCMYDQGDQNDRKNINEDLIESIRKLKYWIFCYSIDYWKENDVRRIWNLDSSPIINWSTVCAWCLPRVRDVHNWIYSWLLLESFCIHYVLRMYEYITCSWITNTDLITYRTWTTSQNKRKNKKFDYVYENYISCITILNLLIR